MSGALFPEYCTEMSPDSPLTFLFSKDFRSFIFPVAKGLIRAVICPDSIGSNTPFSIICSQKSGIVLVTKFTKWDCKEKEFTWYFMSCQTI